MKASMNLHQGYLGLVRRMLQRKGATSETAQAAGHRVHYYRVDGQGQGAPVLFVHGLGGNANGFARVLFPLARRARSVWAVDLPGNGFSPLPSTGALTLEGQLEVLERFVAEVIGEPVFVVGNSLGGAMSIALAAQFPERVRALALIAPGGARLPEPRMVELIDSLKISTTADARKFARRLFARPPWLLIAFASVLLDSHGSPAVKAFFDQVKPTDGIEPKMLGSLSMPVLLLWGGQEKVLPQESVDYFRAHLPAHAHVEVVEHFGHVPQVEHPDAVVERLARFADPHGQ